MKQILLFLCITFFTCSLGTGSAVWAGSYQYIDAKDLNDRLEAGSSSMMIIDICPVEQFAKGHIKGSLETNAYPVKTEEEKARLAKLLPDIKASTDDIIIICPRGGGGAKNTVDFYKANDIDEKRLLILEKGMDKWPYATVSN